MEGQNNSHLNPSTLFEESKQEIPDRPRNKNKNDKRAKENSNNVLKSKKDQIPDVEKCNNEDASFDSLYQGCKNKCRLFLENLKDNEQKQHVKRCLQEVLSMIKLEHMNKQDYRNSVSPIINNSFADSKSFHLNISKILIYAKRIHNIKMSWFQSYEKLVNYLADTSNNQICTQLNQLLMDICKTLSEPDLLSSLHKINSLIKAQQNTTQNNILKQSKSQKRHRNINRSNSKMVPQFSNNNSKRSWNAKSKKFVTPAWRGDDNKYQQSLNSAGIRMKRKPWQRSRYTTSVSSSSVGSFSDTSGSDFLSSSSVSGLSDSSSSYTTASTMANSSLSSSNRGPRRYTRVNRGANNNRTPSHNVKSKVGVKGRTTSSGGKLSKTVIKSAQQRKQRSTADANNSNVLTEPKKCCCGKMACKMAPRMQPCAFHSHTKASMKTPMNPSKPPTSEHLQQRSANDPSKHHKGCYEERVDKIELDAFEKAKNKMNSRGDFVKDVQTESSDSDSSDSSSTSSESTATSDSNQSSSTSSRSTYISDRKNRKKNKQTKKDRRNARKSRKQVASSSNATMSQVTSAHPSTLPHSPLVTPTAMKTSVKVNVVKDTSKVEGKSNHNVNNNGEVGGRRNEKVRRLIRGFEKNLRI